MSFYGYDHGEDEMEELDLTRMIDRSNFEVELRARRLRRRAWICWLRRGWFLLRGWYLFDGHKYLVTDRNARRGTCVTCGMDA